MWIDTTRNPPRWNGPVSGASHKIQLLRIQQALFLLFILASSTYSLIAKPIPRAIHGTRLTRTRLRWSSADIEFLGHGQDAIVRPGIVLLAPPEEAHHFLHDAAIFIHAMGQESAGRYIIRGVILDMPTPFTIGEMASEDLQSQQLSDRSLFRGGEFGGDSAFMLHSDSKLADLSASDMIGSSGVFQGGLEFATSAAHTLDPEKTKFFFNFVEFTEIELEGMFNDGEAPAKSWLSVAVPPEFVLDSSYGRGEAWTRLRNVLRQRGDLN
jgi:putative AlgH/UPF0301 family transcriptional regulator